MKEQLELLKQVLLDPTIKNVLILPHMSPDGDTIGSTIGFEYLVGQFGKEGYIVLDDDIPSNLSFLKRLDRIYSSESVKSVEFDLVVAVDCGEPKLYSDRQSLVKDDLPLVVIDHHMTNDCYGQINIVDDAYSSTGELIYFLYDYFAKDLITDVAEALFTAIVTDTGGFRYSNTRAYTFEVAAILRAYPFDFNRLNVAIFQNKPIEKLKLLNRIFETLTLYCDNTCAVVKLSQALKDELAYSEYDTDGVVEYVRDIKGIEIVIFIKVSDQGENKVSMRSKNDFDVSKIALQFKGGGHKKAAGFKSDLPQDILETEIINKVKEALYAN